MAYNPLNKNGQASMLFSQPVVIASDQSPVSVVGTMSVLGTVPVTQSTSPWIITGSVQANFSGNQSVSGTIGASIVGQLPAGTAMLGSVVAYQGAVPWAVAGSVAAVQTGTWSTSVMTNVITSIATVGQVMGSVAALQATNPWNVAGSVAAFVVGSSSVITVWKDSSVLSVPVGSTVAVLQAPSIVGTYAEDAASASGDKGVFVLGVRNDTVASLVSADLDYGAYATDSAGRTIIKPFAADDSATFLFNTSVVSGSVTLIKASAIGKRSYITDFWFVNSGSVATLITFLDGSTSVLGYAVAPAGTGANSPGINIPLKTAPSQDLAFKQAPSASILYVTVNGYQAP